MSVSREAWFVQLADRWHECTLVVVLAPMDENTSGLPSSAAEALLGYDSRSTRITVPDHSQIGIWAYQPSQAIEPATILANLAQNCLMEEDVRLAQKGGRPVFLAAAGAKLPEGALLGQWVSRCLQAIWPSGGNPKSAGNLHVLLFITSSPTVDPLIEGAVVEELPEITEEELVVRARDVVEQVWPISPGNRSQQLYLESALLDLAAGRLPDLEQAAITLADRLPLDAVKAGRRVRWERTDPPVCEAKRHMEKLGFRPGTLQKPSLSVPRLVGELWRVGLWRHPQSTGDDWLAGLTTRAWTALDVGENPIIVERITIEVLKRTLTVERLARRVLHRWLDQPTHESQLRRALHEPRARAAPSIADQIRHGRQLEESPDGIDDRALVEGATFGQLVLLIRDTMRSDLSRAAMNALFALRGARNQAAHGESPTLPDFEALVVDAATAMSALQTQLR